MNETPGSHGIIIVNFSKKKIKISQYQPENNLSYIYHKGWEIKKSCHGLLVYNKLL